MDTVAILECNIINQDNLEDIHTNISKKLLPKEGYLYWETKFHFFYNWNYEPCSDIPNPHHYQDIYIHSEGGNFFYLTPKTFSQSDVNLTNVQ